MGVVSGRGIQRCDEPNRLYRRSSTAPPSFTTCVVPSCSSHAHRNAARLCILAPTTLLLSCSANQYRIRDVNNHREGFHYTCLSWLLASKVYTTILSCGPDTPHVHDLLRQASPPPVKTKTVNKRTSQRLTFLLPESRDLFTSCPEFAPNLGPRTLGLLSLL